MRYINELKSGDMISDIYLCKTKQTLKTKAGKSYYSMMLQDKTGTVDAKVWELTPGIEYGILPKVECFLYGSGAGICRLKGT